MRVLERAESVLGISKSRRSNDYGLLMRSVAKHISALNRFYGLPRLSRIKIRELYIDLRKATHPELVNILRYRQREGTRFSIEYVWSLKKIAFLDSSQVPFSHKVENFVHDYLHFASHNGRHVGLEEEGNRRTLLNEGLTEFLVNHYWKSSHDRKGYEGILLYAEARNIIDALVTRWNITINELADAYFNGGFKKFKEIVDAKLGDGAAEAISEGCKYPPSDLDGLSPCFIAKLVVKYGAAEAKIRISLMGEDDWKVGENWYSNYTAQQREMIERDTNDYDSKVSREAYVPLFQLPEHNPALLINNSNLLSSFNAA